MTARLATKALRADDLVPEEDELRLLAEVEPMWRRTMLQIHFLVQDALPVNPLGFRLRDESTEALLQVAAQRVVDITETTRRGIQKVLSEGVRDGLSNYEIEQQIDRLLTVTWKNRAEMIASTEIGEAHRLVAIDRYTASGVVDRVKISDATRGTQHTEVCLARAGTTVPLDEAPPLDHPRCSLVLIPVLREGAI